MNILIIGNGFDIAHGLPTTYVDFIKFMDMVDFIRTSDFSVSDFIAQKDNLTPYKSLNKKVAEYFVNKIVFSEDLGDKISTFFSRKPYINELLQLSTDNVWIKYFSKNYHLEKNTWAGFESDISKIVQEFEKIREILKEFAKVDTRSFSKLSNEFISCLYDENYKNVRHIVDNQWYRNVKTKMINDLNSLIRCFEIYLEDCVRNIKIPELSLDILEAEIDKVLSFNYTDTFKRVYNSFAFKSEICYIHGKSNLDQSHENNMVLGIDEYLRDEEKNTNTEFIEFKKFFQRIHKKTGCEYKKWLKDLTIPPISDENNVYVFGHSLAITDKDILKECFNCENIKKIHIFYYDATQYAQQISNLVSVLGQEEMIVMVYGAEPKIVFVEQRSMKEKQFSNWQISNDIYILKNFLLFGQKKLDEVLQRIEEKIIERDYAYFYSLKVLKKLDKAIPDSWGKKKQISLEISKVVEDFPLDFFSNPENIIKNSKDYVFALMDALNLLAESDYGESFESVFKWYLDDMESGNIDANIVLEYILKLGSKIDFSAWIKYLKDKIPEIEDLISTETIYLNYIISESYKQRDKFWNKTTEEQPQ